MLSRFLAVKMKFLFLLLTFTPSSLAIVLNCTFQLAIFDQLPQSYSCYEPILSNIGQSEQITAVFGNHLSGHTNDDVDLLWINNVHSLTYFPRGAENFFRNLKAIGIRNSNIENLIGDELDHFEKLVWFVLNYNLFERVPGDFFSGTPNLRALWLNNNRIKHVGESLLNSLQFLNYTNFYENYCINEAATSFEQMPRLIENLSNNCTDFELTTAESTTTTTTTEYPSCGNSNEIICNLQEQNEILIQKNEELNFKIDEMSLNLEEVVNSNNQMNQIMQEMTMQNEAMNQKLIQLSQENNQIKKMLDDVLEGILELSTRPCAV